MLHDFVKSVLPSLARAQRCLSRFKFNCALFFNIFNKRTFPASLIVFALSVQLVFIDSLCKLCGMGRGDGPVCLLQNCEDDCVHKNQGPCSAIDKGEMIFIAVIPTGFQIEALSEDGGGQNFLTISGPLPFNQDFSNESTFSQIHLAGQYL